MQSFAPAFPQPRLSELHSPAPHARTEKPAEHVITSEHPNVGQGRLSHSAALSLIQRVHRALGNLSMGLPVADAALLQYRADCTALMEDAAARWMEGRESREVVELWQERARDAHNRLSPAWKAAREAQIQQAIADDVGYFALQGDAHRQRLERGQA